MHFHCPIDGQILSSNKLALQCPNGHCFDLAKEGYCNLLLVQQKASLNPGDSKEMIEARRRFLAAGYFGPLADKLVETVQGLMKGIEKPRILDAGCGEGYYLDRLLHTLPNSDLAGIDISKWAIKAAAKNHKKIAWAVASSKQLPFAKNSVDMIVCLFGFPFWKSFQSVLAEGGYLLLVDPGPKHLWELRELIYDEVKETDLNSIDGALDAGFSVVREETVTFSITVEPSAMILDLLAMTPHGYRITPDRRQKLSERNQLTTHVSVVFRLLRSPLGATT
jgi:23S rRNA (guanine745-N1)-methyltransferase